jgi:hypothetical protein
MQAVLTHIRLQDGKLKDVRLKAVRLKAVRLKDVRLKAVRSAMQGTALEASGHLVSRQHSRPSMLGPERYVGPVTSGSTRRTR